MPQSEWFSQAQDDGSGDDHEEVPDLELEDLLAPLEDVQAPKEADGGPGPVAGPRE